MIENPQDKFIELNQLRFHYLDWDNEEATPLVLLHGFTSHAHAWDSFARHLSRHYRVLALDQRGHGQSEWASDYSPERMVEDLEEFVRLLNLSSFTLLGLSMGGRNAYAYTAHHPEKVEKLVIVDIGPELMASGSTRIRTGVLQKDVFEDEEEAYRAARAGNPRADEQELRHRLKYNLMPTSEGKLTFRYDKALRSPDHPLPRPTPEAGWAMLGKLNCPTLLVRGAQSDLLSEEVAERMCREIADCQLVTIPGAGHSVPLDNPQEFTRVVEEFLLGNRSV